MTAYDWSMGTGSETIRYQEHADVVAAGSELSPLVLDAAAKLEDLPLNNLAEAGICRDRGTYFLNIAYPSMQAMAEVDVEAVIASADDKSADKKVALYTHVPFCTAECYYCHYYKEFRKGDEQVDAYLDGIERELALQADRFGSLEAASLYIGGGTPSYLKPGQIERLFGSIRRFVSVPEDIEVTFEVHPESSDRDRLAVLAEQGVNRLNIGVESFDDRLLASENRRHTVAQVLGALGRAHAAGFRNINLDLIYGLKGSTLATWENNLDHIATLLPASATMYYLRLKRGTPEYNLWKRHPQDFPTDYELLLMHAMNFERMEEQLGYTQNPVDWFIRDPSAFHTYQDHNWRRSDETELLGIGPSAYSYVNGWQYYNTNHTGRWATALGRGELPIWRGEYLQGDEPLRRTVMLGIKMGIDRELFARTYGVDAVYENRSARQHSQRRRYPQRLD